MKTQKSIAGKTTGSLMNYLMGNNSTLPQVGKGCTLLSWTDRHAYEVMSVSEDGKRVVIQQYLPERTDKNGMSESQDYSYTKLNGFNEVILWRNGAWRKECSKILMVEEYNVSFQAECLKRQSELGAAYKYQDVWNEMIKPLFDEDGDMMLIEGKTKIQKSYPKVNILWGQKEEYYDYSF